MPSLMTETLNSFWNRITHNKEIMELMKLPVMDKNDSDEIRGIKEKIIRELVTKGTIQLKENLPAKPDTYEIDGIEYGPFGFIRITISLAPSEEARTDTFLKDQIEIAVHYERTQADNAFKIVDLIKKIFVNKYLSIEGHNPRIITGGKNLTPQVTVATYEKIPIRFSYYASNTF